MARKKTLSLLIAILVVAIGLLTTAGSAFAASKEEGAAQLLLRLGLHGWERA
jgi:hypothetical protein